eukprot:gnl/MRDRNA2_/MRDRNA2_109043_c0_seq1.p1 gnl/MRDRNA2_/MRDRNA2_109043_c0~~gnl/MRDRNA2_/MRDRNA2_109043_c0_seq1.p1  ORF type:complete len:479 (+),score=96.22 gnl/MRDRNA2_/MRDRNA2_109043_c0_seq1:45-1439(+)
MSGNVADSQAVVVPSQPSGTLIKVFDAVQAFGCNDDLSNYAGEGIENITSTQFDEIRSLKKPPPVVQRTLEATCMILDAARMPTCQAAPQWDQVKKKIARVDFVPDVLMYDLGPLRAAPTLVSFLCVEYFGFQSGAISVSLRRQSRQSTNPQYCVKEILTFSRVKKASAATAALFNWCVGVLQQVCESTPELQEELPTPASPPIDAEDPSPEPSPPGREPSPEPSKTPDVAPDCCFEDEISFDDCKETVEEQRKHNSLRSGAGYDVIEPHGPAKDFNDRALGPQDITKKLNAFVDALRLRAGLEIQLMPGDELFVGTELMRMRLGSVMMFFVRSGVKCSVSDTRIGSSGIAVRCPGSVICQLLIDRVLTRFFLARTNAVGKASCTASITNPWNLYALVQVIACIRFNDLPSLAAVLITCRSHLCAHFAIEELKPSTSQEVLRLAHEANFLEARFSMCMAEHVQS